jgi:hypothetical protein
VRVLAPFVPDYLMWPLPGTAEQRRASARTIATVRDARGAIVSTYQSLIAPGGHPITLPVGRYTVRVEAPDHEPVEQAFTIEAGAEIDLRLTLR